MPAEYRPNLERLVATLEEATAWLDQNRSHENDPQRQEEFQTKAAEAISNLRTHAGLRKERPEEMTLFQLLEKLIRQWHQQGKPENLETILKILIELTGPSDKDKGAPNETFDEWADEEPPDREWIIKDWLPCGRAALLTGKGGLGKSRLALQLACSIASATPHVITSPNPGGRFLALDTDFCGGKDSDHTVVYATWEDEKDEFSRRLFWGRKNFTDKNGTPLLPLPNKGRLVGHDFAGKGNLWAPGTKGSTHIATQATITHAGEWLLEDASERKARLLIIDSLAAAYGSDENSRAHVRAFMSYFDRWGMENNCAVLFVAHPPKTGGEYSGSTDWHAAARAGWMLQTKEFQPKPKGNKKQPKRAAAHLSKIKYSYSKPGGEFWLRGFPFHESVTKEEAASAREEITEADTGRDEPPAGWNPEEDDQAEGYEG